MNIYEYIEEGEVIDKACFMAAKELIAADLQVISVDAAKNPANVKSLSKLRENPINAHNVSFYFDRDDIGLGIMLRGRMEVIDIDEKVQKGITDKVLQTLEMAWPELYEKLPISITPSGGAHLYYYSDTIGGDGILAYCFDHKGNTIGKIERIDEINKHYIVTAPTPGYHFRQGSPLTMPTLTTEERQFIVAICRSFNEVHITDAPKFDQKRNDAPYKVFNEAHDWRYIIEQITERGWTVTRDLPDRVVIKSPSTKQAQSGSVWKDTAERYNLKNCLYLFTHNSEFEQAKPYGPFDIYKTYYHDGNFMQAQAALAEKGYGKNIVNEGQFWIRHGKKVSVKYNELNHYYKELGYRTHMGQLVQIINNIVTLREPKYLIRQFLNNLEPIVRDEFHERVGTIFSDKGGFMAMLDELDDNFISDTQNSTWLFFRNRAIRVNKDSTEEYLYKELDGYIWQDNVMSRDYAYTDFDGCDAHRFVGILGGQNVGKLEAIIGYMLNRHKDELITKAVILMEDIDPEDEGESMGRSGKGLVFKMIEKFRKPCRMNGKSFSFTDNFLWQNVELDTDIIFIDDVEKQFPFNKLYSVITESMQVNKKNQKQVIIPYEQSPKIFITSNYAVGNSDESTTDRKFEFPVVKFFNANHKPIDEFGRPFFGGWDAAEWARFDNFMVHCAKSWLQSDRRNLSLLTGNSAIRVLINQTHPDFVAYMDDQLAMNFFDFAPQVVKNCKYTTPEGKLITNAVNIELWKKNASNPDYYFVMRKEELADKLKNIPKLSTTKLTQWVKMWCAVKGVRVNLSYRKHYEVGRLYRIIDWQKVGTDPDQSGKSGYEGSDDDEEAPF